MTARTSSGPPAPRRRPAPGRPLPQRGPPLGLDLHLEPEAVDEDLAADRPAGGPSRRLQDDRVRAVPCSSTWRPPPRSRSATPTARRRRAPVFAQGQRPSPGSSPPTPGEPTRTSRLRGSRRRDGRRSPVRAPRCRRPGRLGVDGRPRRQPGHRSILGPGPRAASHPAPQRRRRPSAPGRRRRSAAAPAPGAADAPARRPPRGRPRAAPRATASRRAASPSQFASTQPVERSAARNAALRATKRWNGSVVWTPPISVSSSARRRRSIAASRSAPWTITFAIEVVVVRRHAVARLDRGVDADARARWHHPPADATRRRRERPRRILGGDADLDRVTRRVAARPGGRDDVGAERRARPRRGTARARCRRPRRAPSRRAPPAAAC